MIIRKTFCKLVHPEAAGKICNLVSWFVRKIVCSFHRVLRAFRGEKDENLEISTSFLRPESGQDQKPTQPVKLYDPRPGELEEILVECPKSLDSKAEEVAKDFWNEASFPKDDDCNEDEDEFACNEDEFSGKEDEDEFVCNDDVDSCAGVDSSDVMVCRLCSGPCKNIAEHGEKYYTSNFCIIHGRLGHLSENCPYVDVVDFDPPDSNWCDDDF